MIAMMLSFNDKWEESFNLINDVILAHIQTYFFDAVHDDSVSNYPRNSSTLEHLYFSSLLAQTQTIISVGVVLRAQPHW